MTHPLAGLRILDLTAGLAGPFATRLLSDWGATVTRVEFANQPARLWGDQAVELDGRSSVIWQALNRGKHVLALSSLHDVVGQAGGLANIDLVFEDFRPGLAGDAGIRPGRASVVSITPYGQTGPDSGRVADDVLSWAAGGLMRVTGEPDRHPIPAGWRLTWHLAGLVAATYGLAAHYRQRQTGAACTVDVSVQEVVASLSEYYLPAWTFRGELPTRDGLAYPAGYGIGTPLLADGRRLYFGTLPERRYWDRLAPFLGSPDWANERRWGNMRERKANRQEIDRLVQRAFADRQSVEILTAMQEAEIPASVVNRPADVLTCPQLIERGFWQDIQTPTGSWTVPGSPARLTDDPGSGQAGDSWPDGAPDNSGLPLNGTRVLAFEQAQAGPLATLLLRWLGADVLKVESESRPDLGRRVGPWPPDVTVGDLDGAGYYIELNRGKRSIALDLRNGEDAARARQLFDSADIVVENFRPGTLARLGLAPRSRPPGQIAVSVSGFGQTGPWSTYLAYGDTIEAFAGLMALTGYEPGQQPLRTGTYLGDVIGAYSGALGALAGLVHKMRTGVGLRVDVSMLEAVAATISGPLLAAQGATLEEGSRYAIIRCEGPDSWVVALMDETDRLPEQLKTMSSTGGQDRVPTAAGFQQWTVPYDADTVLALLAVPAARVASVADLQNSPHLRARGFYCASRHPVNGASYPQSGPPARIDGQVPALGPAPRLGQLRPG